MKASPCPPQGRVQASEATPFFRTAMPAIRVFLQHTPQDVHARHKAGHDVLLFPSGQNLNSCRSAAGRDIRHDRLTDIRHLT